MSKKKRRPHPVPPLLTREQKLALREDILDNCIPEGDCLLWQGARTPSGYGVKRVGKRSYTVNRIMLCIATGESFDFPYDSCHAECCHNRHCVNVNHLAWGSHTNNCIQREASKRKQRLTLYSGYIATPLWQSAATTADEVIEA